MAFLSISSDDQRAGQGSRLRDPLKIHHATSFLSFKPITGEDSCNGDSGGPLIARRDRKSSMFLWGVVSSGTRVCGSGKPGIYTRVSQFGDWIRANLRP